MNTLVVLPYNQKGSQGNEIRLCLKTWQKFCQFEYHFIVIGEFDDSLKREFNWVEFIYSKKIDSKCNQYNQHLDVQHCMEIVSNSFTNYNGFIWIADDNYAIKPFNLSDITTVHYHSLNFKGDEKSPCSYWKHDKWKTKQLLIKHNLPTINYTTHYPCYFEFSKLKEIWDKFNMREESYVLEDVYFNYFKHEEPVLDNEIRTGIWNTKSYKKEFNSAINNPNIKFICNSIGGWNKELEKDIEKVVSDQPSQ